MSTLPTASSVATPALTEATTASLHAALSELVRVAQFRDRDHICCHDISVAQCYALETLVEQGPLRLGELAAALFLDKSTASRVVGALERKGYLERQADPADARALQLSVTPAGKALCSQIRGELVAETAAMAEDLEPAALAAAVALLRRLAARLRSRSGEAGTCATSCCSTDGA